MRLSGKKRNCLSGMKRMEEEQEGDTHLFKQVHHMLEFSQHIENCKEHTAEVITKLSGNLTKFGQARR